MSALDRIAFVPALREGSGQGTLDVEAISERLGQPDAAFDIVTLDAGSDIAAQIDEHLAARASAPRSVLFYTSADAVRSEGELILQLDPDHPETGDAFADMLEALTEPSARGEEPQTLVVLELRHKSADPVYLSEIADLARRTAGKATSPVELIVAVRSSQTVKQGAPACSPLTRAILRELDDADPAYGLFASELAEKAFELTRAGGKGGALAHAGVEDTFPVLFADDATVPAPDVIIDAEATGAAADGPRDEPSVDQPPTQPSATDAESTSSDARPTLPLADAQVSVEPATPAEPAKSSAVEDAPSTQPSKAPPPLAIPEARPSTPPPTAQDIVEEADRLAQERQDEEAISKYRKALAMIGMSLSEAEADLERARIHLRIADAMLRLGKGKEAISSFEKALGIAPDVPFVDRALKTLLTLYLGEGDRRGVSSVEERIVARLDPSAPELVTALISFGRAWLVELQDPIRARERLEHARALAPTNREPLRLLMQLAEKEERADEVLALRRAFAELDPDPKSRATLLFELAKELLSRQREDDALDLFEAALEADPAGLAPLEALCNALGERQEWSELESAYRRMIERAERMDDLALKAGLEYELNKRLGYLLTQHLDDPQGSFEALERAAELRPSDAGLRRSAAEVAHRLGSADAAVRHLTALVALEPRDVEAYRLLFEVSMRSEELERAASVASVLTQLGAAGDRERVVLGAEKQEDPKGASAALEAADWVSLRAPAAPGADDGAVELVGGVFRAAGTAIIKAFAYLAARAGRLAPLDETFRVDPETSTVSAARCLFWASNVLGVNAPAMYLEESSAEGMTAVLRENAVTVVGASALRGRSVEQLRFLAGYHLAGHVPEQRIVRLAPNIDDLAACFLAAVVVAVPDTPVPERIRSLVELIVPSFAEFLAPENETALEEAVMAFDAAGGRADLLAYQRATERAGLRAGLVLCDSLSAATSALEFLSAGPASRAEREGELMSFWVSDAAHELRGRLLPR